MEIPFIITDALRENFNRAYIVVGECWIWRRATSNGYGRIKIQGRLYQATRVSLALHRGRWIDPSLFVCHTCDNPSCVNPLHLFSGTPSANMIDCRDKGRLFYTRGMKMPDASIACGENHKSSKLTEKQVLEMFEKRAAGVRVGVIARYYNVTPHHASQVLCGRVWQRAMERARERN